MFEISPPNMRVLIVEDEKEIASFIKNGLKAENFSVDVAFDGEKGLWLAKTNDYDIIVLDLHLPKKNGMEICNEIRKAGRATPIIMLTVGVELKNKLEAFNCGVDDYLTKPFSFEELLARIRALLRREKSIIPEILESNDLILNSNLHIVKRGKKLIKLSRKEFSLLEYLMRNKGIVSSRSIILEHVWDMDADPLTNTVDVHIRYLREKIDKGFKNKLVQTVHGYGYKID